MGRERANVQPALSKPQRGRSPLVIGKRNTDALIAVLHCVRQLHNTKECQIESLYDGAGNEADGAETSRQDRALLAG
jgi:hypothetical protein